MLARRARSARRQHDEPTRAAASYRCAQQAADNYRPQPGAYHYLAGGGRTGVPRADAERLPLGLLAVRVRGYKEPPACRPRPNGPLRVSHLRRCQGPRQTDQPQPGDFGMYGRHAGSPHHVEIYCALPGQEFIGHGSAPIDSATPGRPDYYLTYDFLG